MGSGTGFRCRLPAFPGPSLSFTGWMHTAAQGTESAMNPILAVTTDPPPHPEATGLWGCSAGGRWCRNHGRWALSAQVLKHLSFAGISGNRVGLM